MSDLSPMLPQPPDDNAPMISGRGTKIIADARGAYLAGNIGALIEAMNETQQQRLQEALIQQVTLFVRRHLEAGVNPELEPHLPAIELMLTRPTQENADVVSALRIHNPGIIHVAATLIEHPMLEGQFVFATLMSRDFLGLDFREALEWAYDWRKEATWAILQGKEPSFALEDHA